MTSLRRGIPRCLEGRSELPQPSVAQRPLPTCCCVEGGLRHARPELLAPQPHQQPPTSHAPLNSGRRSGAPTTTVSGTRSGSGPLRRFRMPAPQPRGTVKPHSCSGGAGGSRHGRCQRKGGWAAWLACAACSALHAAAIGGEQRHAASPFWSASAFGRQRSRAPADPGNSTRSLQTQPPAGAGGPQAGQRSPSCRCSLARGRVPLGHPAQPPQREASLPRAPAPGRRQTPGPGAQSRGGASG